MAPHLGFRGRLVLALGLLSALSLGGAFAAVSFTVNRTQQRQFDDALSAVASEVALDAVDLKIRDRPGPAANDVPPLPLHAVLFDPQGQVLDAIGDFATEPVAAGEIAEPDQRPFDLAGKNQRLRGVWLALDAPLGHRVLVAAPRTDLDGDAFFLRRALLVVFGLAVGWTTMVSAWIVRRLTRPHWEIAETAQRVVAGDLTARVGSAGGKGELAELGRNVDEMIDRLSVLLRSKQQFIAHAAHELRSPLTTLYAELTNAVRRERSREEYRDSIEVALASTRRLKLLAEDLLSLARLGADAAEVEQSASLHAVVAQACNQVEAERRERQIEWDVQGSDAKVVGRSHDLIRLMRNLLENAVRYAPDRSAVTIRIETPEADLCMVLVSDRGPGIASSDRERVFEPFFRDSVTRAGGHPGAGLGLTIARDIARLSGGDIDVADVTPPGAAFRVRLPISKRSPDVVNRSVEDASSFSVLQTDGHGQ